MLYVPVPFDRSYSSFCFQVYVLLNASGQCEIFSFILIFVSSQWCKTCGPVFSCFPVCFFLYYFFKCNIFMFVVKLCKLAIIQLF